MREKIICSIIILCFLLLTVSLRAQGSDDETDGWKEAYPEDPGQDYADDTEDNDGPHISASEWVDYLSAVS